MEPTMVVVEAELGWDGRLLGPVRVTGATGENAVPVDQLLAAGRVDELRLTFRPVLGGAGMATTLTTGSPFLAGSTRWRLADLTRGASGTCRLRYVRRGENDPVP